MLEPFQLPTIPRYAPARLRVLPYEACRTAFPGCRIRGWRALMCFFTIVHVFLVQAEECMAKTKTKKADSKQKKAAVKETTATLGWLEAAPIKKLIERCKKAGSLDTEEITEAYNATTHLMQVEAEE